MDGQEVVNILDQPDAAIHSSNQGTSISIPQDVDAAPHPSLAYTTPSFHIWGWADSI